jgi:hypothetical protein
MIQQTGCRHAVLIILHHDRGQDEGACENGDERYGSTETGEFIDLLRHYQLLKKNSIQLGCRHGVIHGPNMEEYTFVSP